MRDELKNKLISSFKFYKKDTPIYCGDGWFSILWHLSDKIEQELIRQYTPDVMAKAYLSGESLLHVFQIKEKFGTLRFQVYSENERINDLIEQAESASAETCENCGNGGKLRYEDWQTVKCDTCHEKEEAKRRNRGDR